MLLQSTYNLLLICLISNVKGLNPSLQRSSVLYGIATIAAEENKTKSLCLKQLQELYDAVEEKKLWAYRMIDVSGRPHQGFFWGNNGWMGQNFHCSELTNEEPLETYRAKIVQTKTNYDNVPFNVEIIVAYMIHNSTQQTQTNTPFQNLINLGLCVPVTCTTTDIKPLLDKYFRSNVLTFQNLYNVNFEITELKLLDADDNWFWKNSTNKIIVIIMSFILIFVISATYYDLNMFQIKQNEAKTKKEHKKKQSTHKGNTKIKYDKTDESITEIKYANNIFQKIFLCFSMSRTRKYILKSEVPDKIKAINGLMAFCFIHLTIYQTFIYSTLYYKNLVKQFKVLESFPAQIVTNSSFSVDTYLFLSGCFATYNFQRTKTQYIRKTGIFRKIHEFLKIIIQRLIRCVPVYIFLMLWSIFFLSYLDAEWSTPLTEKPHQSCRKSWWKNLLFINNLYPTNSDTCMTWTWLIATEMQYYIVGILFLIISTSFMKFSILAMLCLIIFNIYSTGLHAYNTGYILTLDQQLSRLDMLYELPWYRISPYLIGTLTGIFLFKLNGKLLLKTNTIKFFWIAVISIKLYIIFGHFNFIPSLNYSAIYLALSRPFWAISIAWIIIACSTDNAGLLNSILSYNGFQMFHKLSYSTYILIPISIFLVNITYDTLLHYSTIGYMAQIAAYVLYSFCLNYFLTMINELPFDLMIKVFSK